MHRRLRGALVATTLTAVVTPLATAATTAPDPKRLIVKYGRTSVQATIGDRCVPTPDGKGECIGGTKYPLTTTGVITAPRGAEVTLLLGAPAGNITWRAARINAAGGESITAVGDAKVVTKTKKRWRIVLPKNLKTSSKLLGFDIEYPNGYASFEVGLKVRSR